jgi:hypothetical protein
MTLDEYSKPASRITSTAHAVRRTSEKVGAR